MNKKILVLGLEQSNFLSYFYSALKKQDSSLIITAPFVKDLNGVKNDTWMYSNDAVKSKRSYFSIFKAIFYLLFSVHFYKMFCFILFVEGKIPKALHYIHQQINSKVFFIDNDNFKEYDSFHFHYMQYSYLKEFFFIPKNKRIVCHFWGSDLLRTNDILNFYIVKKALNNATIITCQSTELKEIILSKFGRNLEDKVKIIIFGLDRNMYHAIDNLRENKRAIADFKIKFGYSVDKLNILIGHNGNPLNNHKKIIKAIEGIKNKNECHLIVNLNYGINSNEIADYKQSLTELLDEIKISYTFLEHYFNKEELPISRLATDVFVHMPISDALSGTMMEMLYASTVVITGSWLPYKTLRNASLVYHELVDFTSLGAIFDAVITDFESEKNKTVLNRENMNNAFLNDKVVASWTAFLY